MARSELRSPIYGLRTGESADAAIVSATSAEQLLASIEGNVALGAAIAGNPAGFVLQITGDAVGGAALILEPDTCVLLARLGVAVEFAPRTSPPEEDIADILGWN